MTDSTDPGTQTVDPVPVPGPVPIPPTSKQVIEAATRAVAATATRLQHTGKIAWQIGRNVGTTPAVDRDIVRAIFAAARRDRKSIVRVASEATNALFDVRTAIKDAATAQAQGETLLLEQRARLDDMKFATTIDAADVALVVADDIKRLTGPLETLGTILDDARLRQGLIESTLLRRIHSTCVIAIESRVEEVTAQLAALKAETERIHATTTHPDAVVNACRAVLDLLQIDELPLPTIIWPKWSSVGSKHAKGAWIGDPFAVPELKEP